MIVTPKLEAATEEAVTVASSRSQRMNVGEPCTLSAQ